MPYNSGSLEYLTDYGALDKTDIGLDPFTDASNVEEIYDHEFRGLAHSSMWLNY